jgi:hypothetical protein
MRRAEMQNLLAPTSILCTSSVDVKADTNNVTGTFLPRVHRS